jgi:capsule polysaccharide export protein KpsE/RkpR
MGDVVNLRRARKDRSRREKEAKAQENRVAFGRRKDERSLSAAQNTLESARLDAHRREAPEKPE